ncbi:MAG: hypothetical protein JL50_13995 [Peptococcaceae bacterium BICA1-7]|nr:MAG: hypothetical protein JL50_13995 [Peptococcaceae bacterium BICA1-7]HBV96449.1 hypothetical protein [Desulfotomaculum sp.]
MKRAFLAIEESSSKSIEVKRISFDKDSKENVSYKQHAMDLWEKTKPLLREDIAREYSDDQYKKIGAEINEAWVNLQIHSSLNPLRWHSKMLPFLKVLGNRKEHSKAEIKEILARELNLSEEYEQELLSSGRQTRLHYRIL